MLRLADPLTNFIPMLLFLLNIFLAYSLWRSPAGIRKLSRLAALAALVFGLTDWLMLAALPRLNLSYGPVNPAWCLLLVGRIMVLLFMAGALKGLFRLHPRVRTHRTVLGALSYGEPLILWGLRLCSTLYILSLSGCKSPASA